MGFEHAVPSLNRASGKSRELDHAQFRNLYKKRLKQTAPTWTTQKIDQVRPTTSGSFVKLDSEDIPKITSIGAYLNEEVGYWQSAVFYTVWNGTGWDVQRVTTGYPHFANTAPFALDSKGNPHICYLIARITWNRSTFVLADGTVMYATSNQPLPTPTATPTFNPSPSPSVPEFPNWIILPTAVAVAAMLVYFRKRRTSRP